MKEYFKDDKLTVACVGTQHTYGMSYPDGEYPYEKTWPGKLAEKTGYNVLNFGVTGSSITPFGERILRIQDMYKPDVWLLEIPMGEKVTIGYEEPDEIEKDSQLFTHTRVQGPDWELGSNSKDCRINFGRGELESQEDIQYLQEEKFNLITSKWKEITQEDLMGWAKIFAWQVDRNMHHIRYTQEVFCIQCIMESFDKPFMMFQWNYNMFRSPFVELLNKEYWLNETYSGNLKRTLKKSRPDFWADSQHLNEKGMDYIATQIYDDLDRIMARK
tara:strand:- start:930 stop:1748 length:819 start_codon:yes stop_codon:yes gene_type:complete